MTARSTITITFDVGYPLDIAAVDVQNRVSQAASSLPAIVNQAGVTIKKQNPNFVLIVNLTSPDGSVDPVALSNYAYLQIVDPLKRLPGVGDVQIFGERRYSMRVWLDPDKLANLGITAVDVQNAIAEQNVQVAAGKIGQSPAPAGTAFEMQVNARRPAERSRSSSATSSCAPIPASGAAGAAARRRPHRTRRAAIFVVGASSARTRPSCSPSTRCRAPTRSTCSSSVKDKMEELSKRFPKGIAYAMHYDTTRFVSASMHDVLITLGEALVLVVAVVFIFLQSWRTTIIPTIAIPVSLIATLVGHAGARLLAQHAEPARHGAGDRPRRRRRDRRGRERRAPARGRACRRSAATARRWREVTGPIIATTAVLMAVFVPVAFIPGVTGRLYNQFALTVAISVGISAFNSLTLSPALSAAFLRHRRPTQLRAVPLVQRRLRPAVARLCAAACAALIRCAGSCSALFAAGLGATYVVSQRMPSTFLPVEDQGYFFVVIQLPDGASLERTDAVAKKVRDILQRRPASTSSARSAASTS